MISPVQTVPLHPTTKKIAYSFQRSPLLLFRSYLLHSLYSYPAPTLISSSCTEWHLPVLHLSHGGGRMGTRGWKSCRKTPVMTYKQFDSPHQQCSSTASRRSDFAVEYQPNPWPLAGCIIQHPPSDLCHPWRISVPDLPQPHILVRTFCHFVLPALCPPASLFQSTPNPSRWLPFSPLLHLDSNSHLWVVSSFPSLLSHLWKWRTDCHSWLYTLELLLRRSSCLASLVPAVQPQGRERYHERSLEN